MEISSRRAAALGIAIAFLAALGLAAFPEYRAFLPALLKGGIVTLEVFIGSIPLFYASACIAGLARTSGVKAVRWTATVYIELFRGTSLLVQLFWFFFVLPNFGIRLNPMATAILVLGLNFGAFGAEVVRGAILAVPVGQWEAAAALGLRPLRRMVSIVFPQAMIVMLPAIGNLTIELAKSTSLVSAVTLVDITFASVQQNQLHYMTVQIFVTTLVLYYCLSQIVRFGFATMESYTRRHLALKAGG